MKVKGQKWAMLTAYDMYSAVIFEEAEIPVLPVGDSASNNVYGNESTLSITVDELIPHLTWSCASSMATNMFCS